jgi:hypothetical protein
MDPTTPLTPRDVGALLRASAASVRAELIGMSPALAAWHPAAGEWCAKEVLGHLIEAEQRGFAGRIRQILAAPGADPPLRFSAWDQVAVARERRDCVREVGALLEELDVLREASIALVADLGASDLGRGGHHPTVGHLRIGDLLHEWVHHDRNHLKQILTNVQAFAWPHMANAQKFSGE